MNIKKIGIVGSGTMAGQIAELLLKYGFEVTLCSRSEDGTAKCLKGFKNGELADKLVTTTNFKDLKNCGLLIESVVEDENIKRQVFREIETIAWEDAIIASNA